MKILEKIKKRHHELYTCRQPVIAFAGDSVTQGYFGLKLKDAGVLESELDYSESYAEKVKKIFSLLYPIANITIVNAGMGGSTADMGYERLKDDVISLKPDLTVVCYGLNDCMHKGEGLDIYKDSLKKIFIDLKKADSEVIFMTPNMCTNEPNDPIKELEEVTKRVSETINEGWLDKYVEAAKEVCENENIPVCDCYALWKTMDKNGVDITSLLADGKINHPKKEMHWLFAIELVKTIFEEK